jgi:hypothetical protein
MTLKIKPRTAGLALREKTPGPSGVTLEMRKIKRAVPVPVHEHTVSETTLGRFKKYGSVPNRATRRAYARGRRVAVPRPSLVPYVRPRLAGEL